MTVEQRLDQLEKRNKRLTVALTMTVVAMCAVVTMAAIKLPANEETMFDELIARSGQFGTITAMDVIYR